MGDSIERYISEHRDEFDSDQPSDSVWDGIQRHPIKSNTIYSILWKMAAIFLLISTIALLIERTGITVQEDQSSDLQLSEFTQVETYYMRLIASKKAEMTRLSSSNVKKQFLEEIDQLDNVYEELKVMSKRQLNETIITDAMITNLQMRIEVLNKQLNILKSLNENPNENEPSVEI